MDPITIHKATENDLPEIMEIEKTSFPSPWSVNTFITTLHDPRCTNFVICDHGRVVGYCFCFMMNTMIHLLNLAVHPDHRKKGIAKKLLNEIIFHARQCNKSYLFLEVRETNEEARLLYESLGFRHASTWPGYYTDTREDANVMVKQLQTSRIRDVEGKVLNNVEVARETFLISIDCELMPSKPGQFVMVLIRSRHDPFLRRPFAVLRSKGSVVELLYKITGDGTRLLAQTIPGETLRVLGPLGNGFSYPSENENVLYIAGGTGLPPILSMAEELKRGAMIFGARTGTDIPLLSRMDTIPGIDVSICTEDGSVGYKGVATDILTEKAHCISSPLIIYSCGPKAMLRTVSEYARTIGARCEVSLEEYMSCGFGVCSGCVVPTVKGNLRVCKEGPVFDSSCLMWS